MNKEFYIVPGWQESITESSYKKLSSAAKEKGYEVHLMDVDWKRNLSEQVFEVPECAVIFGFSLGAILALKVSQRYPCKHLILASAPVVADFKNKEIKQSYVDLLGNEYVEDFLETIHDISLAEKITTMYGEKENETGDIIVPNTEHELSDEYISKIVSIL